MYLFLVLSILIVKSFGDFMTDLDYVKDCNETAPIAIETLNGLLVNRTMSEEEEFNCFLFCLFTKYQWMDEDGGFFVHEMKLALKSGGRNLNEILYACTAVDSFDRCYRALVFTKCFLQVWWYKFLL
ncbi:hypothetical protein FQR65_LT10822 [Abscondita terminalis]|nr:hypothetical protein FQR65_LT10822 [Abscondita terminalis]